MSRKLRKRVTRCSNKTKYKLDGGKFEHRSVVSDFIGRELSKEEIVHHLNYDKGDNRIENLMLFKNQSEHLKFHIYFDRYGYNQRSRRLIAFRWKEYKQ